MNSKTKLGEFISEKLRTRSMDSSELARRAGISKPYMSQLIKGVRSNPSPELMKRFEETLNLNAEESAEMSELYTELCGNLSHDIAEYMLKNKYARQAVRLAKNKNVSEEFWKELIERLK